MTTDKTLVEILRDYARWMRDGVDRWGDAAPSIEIEDINPDETFTAAADRIEALEAQVRVLDDDAHDMSEHSKALRDENVRLRALTEWRDIETMPMAELSTALILLSNGEALVCQLLDGMWHAPGNDLQWVDIAGWLPLPSPPTEDGMPRQGYWPMSSAPPWTRHKGE